MTIEQTAKVYNALYPDELLEKYCSGERNFARINLLRAELEHIMGPEVDSSIIHPWVPLDKFNPLWADFHNPIDPQFEWGAYGHFVPIWYDDLLPHRNLNEANLSGINLQGSYLYPIDLSNANLSHADHRNTILFDVKLNGADLSYADFRGSIVIGDMRSTNFYMARLERTRISGNLQNANLQRAKVRKASLAGADLQGADLAKARFHRTVLNQAKLQGVDFTNVDLDTVYISGATITVSQLPNFLKALAIHLVESG